MQWEITKRNPSGSPKQLEWRGVKVTQRLGQTGTVWRVTFPNGRTYHHNDQSEAMKYAEDHFDRVMAYST